VRWKQKKRISYIPSCEEVQTSRPLAKKGPKESAPPSSTSSSWATGIPSGRAPPTRRRTGSVWWSSRTATTRTTSSASTATSRPLRCWSKEPEEDYRTLATAVASQLRLIHPSSSKAHLRKWRRLPNLATLGANATVGNEGKGRTTLCHTLIQREYESITMTGARANPSFCVYRVGVTSRRFSHPCRALERRLSRAGSGLARTWPLSGIRP
jgi:hypothetical protein